MPKLTDDKRQQVRELYESGMKVKDILAESGIAKQTFYSMKKEWIENNEAIPSEDIFQQPTEEVVKPQRSVTFKMDPIDAGLDRLNPKDFPMDEVEQAEQYQPEPAYQGDTRFDLAPPPNIPNTYNPGHNLDPFAPPEDGLGFDNIVGEFNLFDPMNMMDQIKQEREKPKMEKKISIPKSMTDPKHSILLKEQTREEAAVENEELRQKCIYVIRKYVYAFKDNLGLQSIVGKTNENREKFVYTIMSKSLKDLQKVESAIKFHVRAEMSGSSQLLDSIILASVKVIEIVGTRMDLRFEGLTNDISKELEEKGQLYVLVREIEIEWGVDAYTSPKKELMFRLGLKLMEVDSKNRLIERQLSVGKQPEVPTVPVDRLKQSNNTQLQEKYQDL